MQEQITRAAFVRPIQCDPDAALPDPPAALNTLNSPVARSPMMPPHEDAIALARSRNAASLPDSCAACSEAAALPSTDSVHLEN